MADRVARWGGRARRFDAVADPDARAATARPQAGWTWQVIGRAVPLARL